MYAKPARISRHGHFQGCQKAVSVPETGQGKTLVGLRINVGCQALLPSLTGGKNKFEQTKHQAQHQFKSKHSTPSLNSLRSGNTAYCAYIASSVSCLMVCFTSWISWNPTSSTASGAGNCFRKEEILNYFISVIFELIQPLSLGI